MFKYILLVTLFGVSALAQTDFKNDAYAESLQKIGGRTMKRLPKGTKVTFEKDIIIPSQESRVQLVGGRNACWISLDDTLLRDVDQVIKAGTQKPIVSTEERTIYFHSKVFFWCNESMKIDELVSLSKGVLSFEFPPPVVEEFVFP